MIQSISRPVVRSLAGAVIAGWLLASAAVHAQTPGAVTPKPAAPAKAAGQGAAPATPQVIRPSATLGPSAPGAGGPATGAARTGPAVGPGPAAGPSGGREAQAAAAANAPRIGGVARYRSVARPDAVLFDAPSDKARKLFLAPQGMPVEVISVLNTWVKVRDPLGDIAWISRDDLTDRRMVMATTMATLRREAAPYAPAWFAVDRGVLLELLEDKPVNGFLKVRYTEGQVGYIQPDQVWGL